MAGVQLGFGTNTITWKATDACGNSTTCTTIVNVTGIATNTIVKVSPNPQQYSDDVTFEATVTNCDGNATGGIVTFTVGTQVMGTATINANGVATLTRPLIEYNAASSGNPPTGTMAPYPVSVAEKLVTASFAGYNASSPSSGTCSLTVTQEDALVYYTGSTFVSTASTTATNATVLLSATVKDINDGRPGDIRNARVRFVNRDLAATALTSTTSATGYYISDWIKPGLVNATDSTVGLVTANWNVNINGDAQQYTLGVIVDYGYYSRNASDDDAVVTVSKPLTDFVTGGGYIIMTDATGIIAPENGKRSNFGFNIKRTKNGVLQGNINCIVRASSGKVYQVKGNAMLTLSVSPSTTTSPAKAVFTGKANIQDITNPLNVISVAGNQLLQVSMTDRGEPGSGDDISIIVWNASNEVWFTSKWDGTRTAQQVIDGGNIKVHSTANHTTGTINTSTVMTSSANPSIVGQPVTFTATITGASIRPTGTYTFVDVTNNAVLGTIAVNTTTGVASLTVGSLSAGLHEIAAYYGGDSRYNPGAGAIDQQVNNAFVRNRTVDDAAATKGPQVELRTVVGPNPTTGYFTLQVHTTSAEKVTILITDVAGRPVETLKLTPNQTIDFGHRYHGGAYFVQVQQGKEKRVTRIIKLN
jgi:hypothetical protein